MFYEQLKKACKSKNTSVTAVLKKLGLGTANGTYWKNGSVPTSDTVVQLAEFLNVTTDYLLTGTENSNNTNISNSTVGSIGTYSNGTVTLGSTTETKSKTDTSSAYKLSENEEELLRIFKSLPKRERVKLLNMVYEFEEDYRNKEK